MMILGLVILGGALVLLIATHDSGGAMGLDSDQIAGLASLTAILLLVGTGFRRRFSGDVGASLRSALIWLLLGLAVVAAYTYRDRAREVGASLLGALRPGTAIPGPGGEVTITRRANGEFSVLAEVNGRGELRFIVDTGASAVVLSAESAAMLGIRPEEGEFRARVATANGTTLAAPVRLDAIAIGPITERNVEAMVSRPGALSTNLLGQSFLTRLPSYEVRGDRLVLRSR